MFNPKDDTGTYDLTSVERSDVRKIKKPTSQNILDAIVHLKEIEKTANAQFRSIGLPIRFDTSKTIARLKNKDLNQFTSFFNREDDSGVVHVEQLKTSIDCIDKIFHNPKQSGLCLGALQSGKTGTANCLHWAGPVIYLLSDGKRKIFPIQLTTSLTSHETASKTELKNHLKWYGDIEMCTNYNGKFKKTTLKRYDADIFEQFKENPTLNNYREIVLSNDDEQIEIDVKEFVHRRVHGKSIKKLGLHCQTIMSKGMEPLLLIDEIQNGASDRMIRGDQRPCVLRQILGRVREECPDVPYIAFSATPFVLQDVATGSLPGVWLVKQRLNKNYVGFNVFGGQRIDDSVVIKTPKIISFSEIGNKLNLPLFKNNQLRMQNFKEQENENDSFKKWAKSTGYDGTLYDYKEEFSREMNIIFDNMISGNDGMCIRLLNNNIETRNIIRLLNINQNKYDIIPWFGESKKTIKSILRNRKRTDLPYIIFITNRARMGDSFPKHTKIFLEFAPKASNLNALLQGLPGRACGYFKETTVIMSDDNVKIVNDWLASDGKAIYPTDGHSVPIKYRRGPPMTMIKLSYGMSSIIDKFLDRVQAEIADEYVIPNTSSLSTRRGEGNRKAPLLKIAKDVGLFDHIKEKQKTIFPQFVGKIEIVKEGETNKKGYGYNTHEALEGHCQFTFRWREAVSMIGRGEGKQTDRAAVGKRLEPQINMQKHDFNTGEVIDDRNEVVNQRKVGAWRVTMVTFPLKDFVQEVVPAEEVLPKTTSPLSIHMTPEQYEAVMDYGE